MYCDGHLCTYCFLIFVLFAAFKKKSNLGIKVFTQQVGMTFESNGEMGHYLTITVGKWGIV